MSRIFNKARKTVHPLVTGIGGVRVSPPPVTVSPRYRVPPLPCPPLPCPAVTVSRRYRVPRYRVPRYRVPRYHVPRYRVPPLPCPTLPCPTLPCPAVTVSPVTVSPVTVSPVTVSPVTVSLRYRAPVTVSPVTVSARYRVPRYRVPPLTCPTLPCPPLPYPRYRVPPLPCPPLPCPAVTVSRRYRVPPLPCPPLPCSPLPCPRYRVPRYRVPPAGRLGRERKVRCSDVTRYRYRFPLKTRRDPVLPCTWPGPVRPTRQADQTIPARNVLARPDQARNGPTPQSGSERRGGGRAGQYGAQHGAREGPPLSNGLARRAQNAARLPAVARSACDGSREHGHGAPDRPGVTAHGCNRHVTETGRVTERGWGGERTGTADRMGTDRAKRRLSESGQGGKITARNSLDKNQSRQRLLSYFARSLQNKHGLQVNEREPRAVTSFLGES